MKDLGTVPISRLRAPEHRRLLSRRHLVDSLHHAPVHAGPGHRRFPRHRRVLLSGARDAWGVHDVAALSQAGPDGLLVGATCDDFSVIAQRLEALGHAIFWWEIPPRRAGGSGVALPGGSRAGASQVVFVTGELQRIAHALESVTHASLTPARLADAIAHANTIRAALQELRTLTFTAPRSPLPALELLIAEMLAIHYCSDRPRTREILQGLLREVRPPRRCRSRLLRVRCGPHLLGQSSGGPARHESRRRMRRTPLRHRLHVPSCPGSHSHRPAAVRGPGAHGPCRSHDRHHRRSGRPQSCRMPASSVPKPSSSRASPGPATAPWKEISSAASWRYRRRTSPSLNRSPALSDALRPALRTRLEALVETVRHRRHP